MGERVGRVDVKRGPPRFSGIEPISTSEVTMHDMQLLLLIGIVILVSSIVSMTQYARTSKRYDGQQTIADQQQARTEALLDRQEALLRRAEDLVRRLESRDPS